MVIVQNLVTSNLFVRSSDTMFLLYGYFSWKGKEKWVFPFYLKHSNILSCGHGAPSIKSDMRIMEKCSGWAWEGRRRFLGRMKNIPANLLCSFRTLFRLEYWIIKVDWNLRLRRFRQCFGWHSGRFSIQYRVSG